jgi:hypothetical protein
VSPLRYELGFYIPEDDILHSHRCENLTPHIFKNKIHCSRPDAAGLRLPTKQIRRTATFDVCNISRPSPSTGPTARHDSQEHPQVFGRFRNTQHLSIACIALCLISMSYAIITLPVLLHCLRFNFNLLLHLALTLV